MHDVAAIITALNLQGPTDGSAQTGSIGSNVYEQIWPDESNINYPCVLVTTEDEDEEDQDEGENFIQDGVTYPVRVMIFGRTSERYQKARPTYQLWRYLIAQTFKGLPTGPFPFLPSVPECWDIRFRRLRIFDRRAREYQMLVSGLVIQCLTVTPRWTGGQPPAVTGP